MPNFALKPTPKWKRPTIAVPFYGTVKKPVSSSHLVLSNEAAAKWLIVNGYCQYLAPEEVEPPCAPGNPEQPVRQVIIGEGDTLELDPPLQIGVPGDGEEYLINFFTNSTPSEINKAIRAISVAKAEELKAMQPLVWSEVVKVLTEKQLEVASKWAIEKMD